MSSPQLEASAEVADTIDRDSSEDMEDDGAPADPLQEDGLVSPRSTGNKRGSCSSTAGSTASKRSKSPSLRAMESMFRERNELIREKFSQLTTIVEKTTTALPDKIKLCHRLAAECGVTAETNCELFKGLLVLLNDENMIDSFICSTTEGRRATMELHMRAPRGAALPGSTTQAATGEPGQSQVPLQLLPRLHGSQWLAGFQDFLTASLLDIVHDIHANDMGCSCGWLEAQNHSFRQAEDRFERSLATISHLFDKVLTAVVKLAVDIIKPSDPEYRELHPRLRNARFYPYFNDCIGAMDGTHIECVVPAPRMLPYLCRKGTTTQNVLAICDLDMRFTFVLPGWPGSAHDMRVFEDATTNHSAHFPHPPAGKFYLVDSGYSNRIGYLAPYKGSKYHVPEFSAGPPPDGKEETFNCAHSSLRNVIERSFGVLKMKWRILQKVPSFEPRKQSKIIIACCALHNFIRSSSVKDKHFARCESVEHFVPREGTEEHNEEAAADDCHVMNAFRESIALALLHRS